MKQNWPQDRIDPFKIKNEFTWSEIGAIFRIIGEHDVRLVIETGVGRGDLAAWMIAKASFDPDFNYVGISNDPNSVDPSIVRKVSEIGPQAFIAVGAPCSTFMIDRSRRFISNSPVALVLCDGTDIHREVDHYLPILRTGDVIVAHRFLEVYKARKIMDASRNGQLERIVGDWMLRTRLIAGVLT